MNGLKLLNAGQAVSVNCNCMFLWLEKSELKPSPHFLLCSLPLNWLAPFEC